MHNSKRKNSKKFILLIVILIGVLSSGYYVYSKYYSIGHQKGVGVASGFYFSSNYLVDAKDKIEHTASEVISADFEKFASVINTDTWDGKGTYDFDIRVCNYANQLLYNDENLNIEYTVYFQMEEIPTDGTTYKISYVDKNGNVKTYDMTTTDVYKIGGNELKGGKASYDKFTIEVTPENDENYTPVGIAVWAEPDAPDYLKETSLLAGIVKAVIAKDNIVTGEPVGKFDIVKSLSGWEQSDKDKVDNLAALNYLVTTTGIENAAYYKITLTWSDKIQLNQYDEHILDHTYAAYDAENRTITINVPPYSTVPLIFYKTDGFDTSTILSLEEFEQLVTITYE